MKPETAAKLVGQIYDCVLRPEGWPQFLKSIAISGENAGSSIVVHDVLGLGRGLVFEHGADQKHLRLYFDKLAASRMPASRRHVHTVGDVTTMTMLCGDKELVEHDFYRRWVKPSGLRDMIAVLILKSNQRLAWFWVARTEIQEPYGESDMNVMDELAPHICRAFTMADVFEMREIRLQQLEAAMEALSTGVFLADRRGITYMNGAAKRMVDQGRMLKIKNNRLTTARPRINDPLHHALEASVGGTAPGKSGSHVVAVHGEDGGGLLASVLPLNWREARNPLVSIPGSAAIFVQDVSQAPEPAGQAFAKLYNLTPAELRVCLGIAGGKGLPEVTANLKITTNTAKTHLKHIYAKTGVTRQGDLIRLIMLSTPPLRPAGTP